MSIRTRLFVGTALLVLALVGVQWWLQIRQLNRLQGELVGLAASVGQGMVLGETTTANASILGLDAMAAECVTTGPQLVDVNRSVQPEPAVPASASKGGAGVTQTLTVQGEASKYSISRNFVVRTEKDERAGEHIVWTQSDGALGKEKTPEGVVVLHRILIPRIVADEKSKEGDTEHPHITVVDKNPLVMVGVGSGEHTVSATANVISAERIELTVVTDPKDRNNTLIVRKQPGREVRVPVDLSPTIKLLHDTFRKGLLASAALLIMGMMGAALMAHRVTRPLRVLAQGFDAVGLGSVGTQVPVSEAGEIGDLQKSFNQMSAKLSSLEEERERWQAREHLAELGDLARGLGHTLRNPLNTLGLAVEEMAGLAGTDGGRLASVARGQIRRIDRWLVSFLSLGAGRAAEPEDMSLVEVVGSVALELSQIGRLIQWSPGDEELWVRGVPGALRAAFTSLIENAVEASPPQAPVEVAISRDEGYAVTRVSDSGAGIPEEIRQRLFSPHATTKTGGSGMGLYLAKQIIEVGHGGSLELCNRVGGGTVAVIKIPLGLDSITPYGGEEAS